MLLNKMEDTEHARFRALSQLIIDKDEGIKAYEDYMKIAFPYLEGRKNQQKKDAHAALMHWVKTGPMRVTPMAGPLDQAKSKLKSRMVARMAPKHQQDKHSAVIDQWNQRNKT